MNHAEVLNNWTNSLRCCSLKADTHYP